MLAFLARLRSSSRDGFFGLIPSALAMIAMAAVVSIDAAPAAAKAGGCNVPRELLAFKAPLPVTTIALTRKPEVHVVALGSSSTAGAGASGLASSYPSRLDSELDSRFPGREVRVSNFGKGGQLADDMLKRITADVLPIQPSLVIWQTGVNDAIRGVPAAEFRNTLTAGVKTLLAVGIDVILIDMQFYPRSERVAGYEDFLRVMREVAEQTNVPLLRRFSIMKHLIKSGQYTSEELLAPDGFHLNDLSYGCLATLITDAIEDTVKSQGRDSSHLDMRRAPYLPSIP